jgi:hypothetical protein
MEMNFRRWITALAVLTLFAGLASAQVLPPQQMNCVVSAASVPNVRTEGLAERVGDVLLTCTAPSSVTPASNGVTADRATITVNFGVAVTSRGVGCYGAGAATDCATEAMLTVDEPGTNLLIAQAGWGPNFPVNTCTYATNTTATSCPAFALSPAAAGTTYWVVGATTLPAGGNAQNAYQGFIPKASATSLTFNYVPVVAPGASNIERVYRITNVRVTPGNAAITATVTATPVVGFSNTTLALTNTSATVATPATSLLTSLTAAPAVTLCVSPTLPAVVPPAPQNANLALLTFKEGFANAFKPYALPIVTAASAPGDAMSAAAAAMMVDINNVYTVGAGAAAKTYNSYNSETMTLFPATMWTSPTGGGPALAVTAGGATVGLADSGTRLKAVFSGLDKNAQYYVSVNNVTGYSALTGFKTGAPNGAGDNQSLPYAQLISMSTTLGTGETIVEPAPVVGFTNTANGVVPVVQLTATKPSVEVVWEVTNDSGGANAFTFAVYTTYSATVNPPTAGNTATVTLGYAPTNGTATTTPVGYTTSNMPRFVAPSMAPATFFNVVICQTVLMFPYVANVSGYETGIAISNTAQDPWGTSGLTGSCTMNFYGTTGTAPPVTYAGGPVGFVNGSGLGTMAPGAQIANTISGLGMSNFTGYVIAVCNFQYAHGFAFIQNRTQTLGMGYLGLVMNGTNRAQTVVGETFSQ